MMEAVKATLSNVVLGMDAQLASCPAVAYRATGAVDYSEEAKSLAFEGKVDFLTYLNALSWGKWKKYTCAERAALHIELAGDPCMLQLKAVFPESIGMIGKARRFTKRAAGAGSGTVSVEVVGEPVEFDGFGDFVGLDVPVPEGDYVLVGFELQSSGATEVRDAYWYTEVEQSRIRPVRIAIATTTFKKERYVVPNIEAIEEGVLGSDPAARDAFHMYVVDNGSTLDTQAFGSSGVTVIPNANVGGAGGFARGMMAALDAEGMPAGAEFTHVLLMDDDIRVLPESLVRTRNLLALRNDAYEDAFLNGAMLSMQQPNLQFEDVAVVGRSGNYARIKGDLFVDDLSDAVRNEMLDVEVPRSYGAWWYSCIPMSAVRRNGLPLPFFIRCDDVEFGLRNRAKYMTMNGICVWHDSFEDKFNPTMSYQSYRNQLIMDAVHGVRERSLVPFIIERALRTQLRNLNYDAADLIVASLEDYLEGPGFIMGENPEALLREHNARGEKLVPLDEAIAAAVREHPELRESLWAFKPSMDALKLASGFSQLPIKAMRLLPYDKHLLPDVMLRDAPATAYFGENLTPDPSQVATRVIVACDRAGRNAHVRVMDRRRYEAVRDRWRRALGRFRAQEADFRQAYKDAMPEMTSVAFWREYLERANEAVDIRGVD